MRVASCAEFQKRSQLFVGTHNEALTHAIRDFWPV